jgi:hypothetical protein
VTALIITLHVLSFVLGRTFAAACEWGIHRYIFHGSGKRRGSPFSFHYRDHHRACRKQEMVDTTYTGGSVWSWSGRAREVWGCALLSVLLSPLLLWTPLFVLGAWYGGARYLYVHQKTHLDPQWCLDHAPWHYDHHMAPDQDANWGVTIEWLDRLCGTRKPWPGRPVSERRAAPC